MLLNADAKLRTLINDPALLVNRDQELIPVQLPVRDPVPISFHDSLVVALKHRPEIDEVRKELKASCVRQDVAKNELRPVLNLILTTLCQRFGRRREHRPGAGRSVHARASHLFDRDGLRVSAGKPRRLGQNAQAATGIRPIDLPIGRRDFDRPPGSRKRGARNRYLAIRKRCAKPMRSSPTWPRSNI